MSVLAIKRELRELSNREKADAYKWFFKTGKGQYGEGDRFVGVIVPTCRVIAKKYENISFAGVSKLLKSKVHEHRMIALFILVSKFQRGSTDEQQKIYNFYLENTKYINNWDLVDLSAHKIVGEYMWKNPTEQMLLNKLAISDLLWERRISVISTFYFIGQNKFDKSLEIAKILVHDKHDLIHKAVGWMLREIGKRNQKAEEEFLKAHYKEMPRTMLRYAIEKFPEDLRQRYLTSKI